MCKRLFHFGIVACVFLVSAPAKSQGSVNAKVDSGSIDGVRYKIFFPENGENKLVMYAHGYEFMNTPGFIDNPNLAAMVSPFLRRGFAVAVSAYRIQGYSLPEGIEDTEALRAYFSKEYGSTDSSFIVGISMGGGVALGTIERFSESHHGALAMCPLSSRPYLQTRKEFDLIAVFNVMYPGLLPSLAVIMNPDYELAPFSFREAPQKTGMIRERLKQDSLAASQLARRFDLKVDDLPFTIFFGQGVLRDIAIKAGGNPYDNTNTLYSGFPDDWMVNQKIERLPADPKARQFMYRYNPTGKLTRPAILLHTIYDPLIPPDLAVVNYDNMVHQSGAGRYLVVKYTDGQGHCRFTPEQIGFAFDELRNWASTGRKPQPGSIE